MADETGLPTPGQKVTYVVSEIDKSLAFEWIANHLKGTFDLEFILLNNGPSYLSEYLSKIGVPSKLINLETGWKRIFTGITLFWHFVRTDPEVVHTHMRAATQLGITAALLAGVKKRIHTRHSSSYNHLFHPRSVKWDKWITKLSTHIVSISEVVNWVLIDWENTPPSKVHLIHHGFDLSLFKGVSDVRKNEIRNCYLSNKSGPVIGMISRYMEWKGIAYGIKAFKEFRNSYPEAHLILANAKGPYKGEIQKELELLPSGSYTEIEFEEDIAALYATFDIMIHVPIDPHVEAFGQTYVEALAAGVPSIVTLSGIAHEFIQDRHNALVVPYRDSDAILEAMNSLMRESELRNSIITNGRSSAEQFRLEPFIEKLKVLYER